MINYNLIEKIQIDIEEEFIKASKKYGAFNSPHEGYAILLEEFNELWDGIKLKSHDPKRIDIIQKNAIQIGAMAIRLIYDCSSAKYY